MPLSSAQKKYLKGLGPLTHASNFILGKEGISEKLIGSISKALSDHVAYQGLVLRIPILNVMKLLRKLQAASGAEYSSDFGRKILFYKSNPEKKSYYSTRLNRFQKAIVYILTINSIAYSKEINHVFRTLRDIRTLCLSAMHHTKMSYLFSPQYKFSTGGSCGLHLQKVKKISGCRSVMNRIAEMKALINNIDFENAKAFERQTRLDVMGTCLHLWRMLPKGKTNHSSWSHQRLCRVQYRSYSDARRSQTVIIKNRRCHKSSG
jgi:RNA-binding protein YhbY